MHELCLTSRAVHREGLFLELQQGKEAAVPKGRTNWPAMPPQAV
jgi:hypothetical protein